MSLPIPPEYFANWINFQEIRRVFNYNTATGVWTPTADAENRAEIQVLAEQSGFIIGNSDEAADGSYALLWDADGNLKCGWVTDKIYAQDYPRLEFYRQTDSVPTRFAALGKSGILSVLSVTEDVTPSGQDRLLINEKISLGKDGLLCKTVNEINLLTTSEGEYLISSGGEIISLYP